MRIGQDGGRASVGDRRLGRRIAAPPDRDYRVFVASEGNDRIALVRFGPAGIAVEREQKIGANPTELAGPHGLYVSPDGRSYYVSTAHGTPNGALWKFSTETGEQAGRVELGRFPATVQVAPGGHYAWVVNFNLYGAMVPSSVSVVYTDDMVEVRRIPTCVMPHGSRLSPDGTPPVLGVHDERRAGRDRRGQHGGRPPVHLKPGAEHGHERRRRRWRASRRHERPRHGSAEAGRRRLLADLGPAVRRRPHASGWPATRRTTSWRSTSPRGRSAAASRPARGSTTWRRARTDGWSWARTSRGKSVSVIDAATAAGAGPHPHHAPGAERAGDLADSRYAFVTQEGVGAEPGAVDVIDLRALARVASVDVGQQAGGIDLLESATP